MYLNLDVDLMMDVIGEYVYGEEDGTTLQGAMRDLYEGLIKVYGHSEINAVMKGFQLAPDSEEQEERLKAFKKINKLDVADITAQMGFLYGVAYARQDK